MVFASTAVVVLIASPGDTPDERSAVYESLGKWNVSRGEREGVVLVPWLYEQHAVPRLGSGPQSVINEQALERADIVVAFFDARLGNQTPEAVSGTAEEILKANEAGKPVHVYFSTEAVARDRLDVTQLGALSDFRSELSAIGLLGSYSSPADLGQQVQQAVDFDVASHSWSVAAPQTYDRPVKWRLAHRAGDSYVAENIGEGTAHDAQISAYDDLHIMNNEGGPQDVPPGEALSFMAALFLGTQDDRVKVTWHEAGTTKKRPGNTHCRAVLRDEGLPVAYAGAREADLREERKWWTASGSTRPCLLGARLSEEGQPSRGYSPSGPPACAFLTSARSPS